ncbi:MAG: hypothetical protein Q9218_001047 [Villophora microphyllina]
MASLENPTSKPSENSNDRHAELEHLVAQATSRYSVKDYDAAAEFYSKASLLQAEINGEMAAENADLLYAYGRCLYHLAVRSSDVLGSKVAGEKRHADSGNSGKLDTTKRNAVTHDTVVVEEGVAQLGDDEGAEVESDQQAEKPYFQFTGDENFDDSDDEDDPPHADGEAGEGAEEDDDFANAFEVLDLARVLLLKRIAEEEEKGQAPEQDKNRSTTDLQETVKQLRERLADTHDLQAEIYLESERFPNAVADLRAALGLKKAIFPKESCYIAEAHYKLSLALEFSSVTRQKNEDGDIDTKTDAQVDEAMLKEAAEEMEAAIVSCELRICKEEEILQQKRSKGDSTDGRSQKTKSEQDVKDVKEMVVDMKQRLLELRETRVAVDEASQNKDVNGILGSILGQSPVTQQERLDEAAKGATDLSNLIKRKKPLANAESSTTEINNASTGSKRKVDSADQVMEVGTGKKARLSNDTEEEV